MYNNSKINHNSGAKFPPLLNKEQKRKNDKSFFTTLLFFYNSNLA